MFKLLFKSGKFSRRGGSGRRSRGFGIVEFLVAAAVFSIIVTAAGGIFVQILKIQRRGLSAQKIQENAQFVLETIAKEIRVSQIPAGQDADCDLSFSATLDVIHPTLGSIRYQSSNGTVQRVAGGATTSLSGNDVEFTRFAFCIQGSELDDRQARVTLLTQVRPKFGAPDPALVFNLQTTLASRDLAVELQN